MSKKINAASPDNLGILNRIKGNFQTAEPLLRESLALCAKRLARRIIGVWTSRKAFRANVRREIGKFEEAEFLLPGSYENLVKKLGDVHEQKRNARKRVERFESL